ncbi:hypothetical protein [Streptomyces tubercidicus]|uniref:hypothetical protein n=1 Tax=Streptomyces tubercidicus TaxID=47759 RepID=UPI00369606E0
MSATNAPKARRTGRARRLVLGGALTGALTAALSGVLAGCGIAPTDVIDAGEPATGVKSPGRREAGVQLFFYGPSGLRSATRPTKESVDPQTALAMLMKGPNHAERMRGLTSVLPKFLATPTAETVKGAVLITLPAAIERLGSPSLNQLVCTAANARVPGNMPAEKVTVTLRHGDDKIGPLVCGGDNAFPVIKPSPPRTEPSGASGTSG